MSQVEVEPKTKEDEQMAHIISFKNDPRFEALKDVVEDWIEDLESMRGIIKDTDTPELIGYRFLAVQTATHFLRSVVNLPDAIAKAKEYEQQRQTEAGDGGN